MRPVIWRLCRANNSIGKGTYMPARAEKILIFPIESGQPAWIMWFPVWWDFAAFINTYHHREIDLRNPIDANYAWVLTSTEAIMWNENCTKHFSENQLNITPGVIEAMHQLEVALSQASWVIVESYEWESGLD